MKNNIVSHSENLHKSEIQKRISIKKIILWSVLAVLIISVLMIVGVFFFMIDYFPTKTESIEAFNPKGDTEINIIYDSEKGYIVCEPKEPIAGFIIYPGARVEHDAYVPLAKSCAKNGILCVVVDMPMNFSLMDSDAALLIRENYKNINTWYIGGHSLGGYSASMHLEKNSNQYDGIIFLASYSAVDLTDTSLGALCIYGDKDEVMNKERFEESVEKLPSGFDVIVIEGGCHAYFGMYEGQDEDDAQITNEEQIEFTAECISDFILERNNINI